MAVSVSRNTAGIGSVDNVDGDSDYGSDFSIGEEQLVGEILAEVESSNAATSAAEDFLATTIAGKNRDGRPRAPVSVSSRDRPAQGLSTERDTVSRDSVEYPDLSSALSSLEPDTQPAQQAPPPADKKPDARTPLRQFRSYPRRPLTVTDLAAGAWCELQHWYTLTRLPGGKKTVTTAMRGGSRVHKKLEDEVHSAVQVNIASKEEAFALRLWNIIQGMRTLRDTGITRELEVWGIVDGEVFNGVIDQLTHESPNAGFEEELNLASSNGSATQQSSIMDYIGPSHKTVYLTDVKTRDSDRLPTGTTLRPAKVQLFLYHRLLSDMASRKVDYSAILERYGLNGEAHFSDAFTAQIGSLHDEIFYDADSDLEDIPSPTHSPDLIGYRSITQIIPLLTAELEETFPLGAASIGSLLAVQYHHRDDGRILGNNSFLNDPDTLDDFVKHNLRWWRGERAPEGVAIEETYKCGWCEFAETCQWRRDKEAEFLQKKKMGRWKVGRMASAS